MTSYMKFSQVSTLEKLERLNNSRNGNPRFKVTFADGRHGKTDTDAGFAYAICDSWQGERVRAVYRITPSGNIAIMDLELAQ
jgi:hypothetical protein